MKVTPKSGAKSLHRTLEACQCQGLFPVVAGWGILKPPAFFLATAVRSQALWDIPTFQLTTATGLEQMPLRVGHLTSLGSVTHAFHLSFVLLSWLPIYGCKQCLIISSLSLSFASLMPGYSLSAACHPRSKPTLLLTLPTRISSLYSSGWRLLCGTKEDRVRRGSELGHLSNIMSL